MNLQSTMEIFFAADDKYAPYLCVSIASILKNANSDDKFNFYILDGGISKARKTRIEDLRKIHDFNVEFVKINDETFEECPITRSCVHISKPTYYRYIIPRVKPNLDKCFYFDCDIIVEKSLDEFWKMDFENNYAIAVEELHQCAINDAKRLNVDTIFNAGVLLINLKKWKEDNIEQKLFENTSKLASENNLIWQDQDVLNYTFANKVKFISPKYNPQCNAFYLTKCSTFTEDELENAKKDPTIIHYNSDLKPWEKNCQHGLKNRYQKYFMMVHPFFGMTKK